MAVEDVEDVVSKRGRVSEGEELAVDLLEFLLGEHAQGTVLQETWSVVRFAIFGKAYLMYLVEAH